MSDTDDGFDKEAARRELREKYEDEREDRETTARMSELLLQGATMTNQHCERCGSPIFRFDGQEFCPTCQHEADQAEDAGATGQETPDERTANQQIPGQQLPDQQKSGQQTSDENGQPKHTQTPHSPDRQTPNEQPSNRQTVERQPSEEQSPEPNEDDVSPDEESSSRHQQTDGRDQSRSNAEAALESSISALARRAATADDPRNATEYLEAAREAAEALAALRHST